MKKTMLIMISLLWTMSTVWAQDITIMVNGKKWNDETIKKGDVITVKVKTEKDAQVKLSVEHRSVIAQMDVDYAQKINKTVEYTSKVATSPEVEILVDDFINGYTSRLIIKMLDVTYANGKAVLGINYRKTYSLYAEGKRPDHSE